MRERKEERVRKGLERGKEGVRERDEKGNRERLRKE